LKLHITHKADLIELSKILQPGQYIPAKVNHVTRDNNYLDKRCSNLMLLPLCPLGFVGLLSAGVLVETVGLSQGLFFLFLCEEALQCCQ